MTLLQSEGLHSQDPGTAKVSVWGGWQENSTLSAQRPSGRRNSLLFAEEIVLFAILRPSIDSMDPQALGRAIFFIHLLTPVLTSFRNTLTDTPSIMFEQMPGYPVAQANWHIKLAITHVFPNLILTKTYPKPYKVGTIGYGHPFKH